MPNLRPRPKQIMIAFDQFCNALLGGWPDETLSARIWRHKDQPGWHLVRLFVDGLFFWQWRPSLGGHCQQSWQAEIDRAQMPPELRPDPQRRERS